MDTCKMTTISKNTSSEKSLKEKMNIVIVGHVDHGKSTVIGRLLADTDSLPSGKLEQVKADCERNAKPFEYAFLLDALKDEQAQGITIDSARCFFKSSKRQYIIIDAPGHIEFLKNMVSGAARAEAALLVIDAKEGIKENSKRHGYLLSMLGIRQVAVCVNKMDLVGYKESVFNKIEKDYQKFLKQIGIEATAFIPLSAFEGENMVKVSKAMKWYKGKCILAMLDAFKKAKSLDLKPFRMPVQGVYKFTAEGDDRRLVAGRVESGKISVGDEVIFLPSNKRSTIQSIEGFKTDKVKTMAPGFSTSFTLREQIYINRGDIMCRLDEQHPLVSSLIEVEVFWMGREPFVKGKEYKIKIGTLSTPMTLKEINTVIDASDLNKSNKNKVERHDVARVVIECATPIAFDLVADIEATGRFVIVDEYDIAGGGIVRQLVKDDQADVREQVLRRQEKWDFSIVDPQVRREKYGHRAKLLLLTGPVGVDKKTIAKEIEKLLFEKNCKTYFLGIGNLLRGLDSDVEKEKVSRHEHVRRLGEVAHLLMDAGLIVLATASQLNDDELKMLYTVCQRESMLIVNVGKNNFRHTTVDLELQANDSIDKQIKKVLALLNDNKVILDA
jgi:bifunctional enzyme CysN/CysC